MEQKKNKGWAVASLTTGILGNCLAFMPYFGLPLSIMAVVFRQKHKESGMATAGLVLGILGIVINVILGVTELIVILGTMALAAKLNGGF